MKSILLAVALFLFTSTASAQYFVPNQAYGNFNGGYTYVTPYTPYQYFPVSPGGYYGGGGNYGRGRGAYPSRGGYSTGTFNGVGPGGYYSGSSYTIGNYTGYQYLQDGNLYSGGSYQW